MADLSPMMQQYMDIKDKHPDQILFFRLGDFYEMFYDDAKMVSKELNLVLTGKLCGQEERAPMCGIPFHSSEAYISRLIKKGYKVAICEQTEDPKLAKSLVKRDVIRIVTPGTIIEDQMLEEGANNYICSVFVGEKDVGISTADISTGRVSVTALAKYDRNAVKNEILRFSPSEIVLSENSRDKDFFREENFNCCVTFFDNWGFDFKNAEALSQKQFPRDFESLNKDDERSLISSLGGLLSYLFETQKIGVERLVSLETYESFNFMHLDETARRNLEITKTMRTGDKKGSLLWVMDKTQTAMGKRLLRKFMERPLTNPIAIEKRLNAVEELFDNNTLRMDLREQLASVFDMERLLTRIICGTTNPRELITLKLTGMRLPMIKDKLSGVSSYILKDIRDKMDTLEDICEIIEKTINDDPPALIKDGGYIKGGFSEKLDELRGLLTGSHNVLTNMEAAEKEKTGIKALKIGFNKVFGYYIEITNSFKGEVPDYYIRKQTLTNCERYITEDLKNLENEILTARERSVMLESAILGELREKISEAVERIQNTANAIASLDVECSLAHLAKENNYVRPEITKTGEIVIEEGRHPVVEQLLNMRGFVPNDLLMDKNENRIAIITGPNMAGKSTYIRQTAIIVLMAQIGSFVPAKNARIGVVDGIYTRVGASDDLATGQSTFMVEMNEVANILKNATGDSLLILDEVGRGTSTFDGMSIARATLEYIADVKRLGAKTLFATHYHELTDMEDTFPCIKNYNTAVKKRGENITFLRRIVKGAVDDSYGIEVSKLAGIPDWIIKRAHEILLQLEKGKGESRFVTKSENEEEQQMTLVQKSKVEEILEETDLNTLTPIEALSMLFKLKDMI